MDDCIRHIEDGNSLILHGTAGAGKSGLTSNLIEFIETSNIPYIALKLDKRTPFSTVRIWSESIGLPASLVHCLNSVSKDSKAVIILDQLDALRWTSPHSKEALQVCTELIRQVHNINFERSNNISVVFVCRTYDLKNDNSIRAIFDGDKKNNWTKVEVGKLKEETIQEILGKRYVTLTDKLKSLLRLPSNLYIWQQLKSHDDSIECTSTFQLATKWWSQLVRDSISYDVDEKELENGKLKIIDSFSKTGKLKVISSDIGITQSAIDYLVSAGFMIKQPVGTASILSFVHHVLL